jgi:hypothetical protein
MEDGVTDKGKAPDLERLKRMVEEWRSLTADARLDSEISIDYYDTKQWTAEEKGKLAARNQPDIAFNRIKPAVNGIMGVTERGRSDPRAYPRTPNDEDSADVVTDVLRYIADQSRFKRTKQDCFLDMLVPGTMACVVEVDDDLNVQPRQVRWEEFIYDPRSRRKDFEDARYKGIAKWQYVDDIAGMYPEVPRDEIEAAVDGGLSIDAGLQDRPTNGIAVWVDKKQRRLLHVELYYKEAGKWHRACFLATKMLDYGPSPYVDDKGRPDCPIVAQSAYVDRDNARYGAVKDMRGPQDEINKRRSKLLSLVSQSQIQAVDPQAQDIDASTARAEAARPDGVLPFGWQKVPTTDMATGQHLLLTEAKQEIERLGPNPAVVGRDNADASGRALQARTQAGLIELAPIYSGQEDWELRVYRQCWARVKQYWKEPQFVRVTDDEDAPRFIGLNVPRGAPVIDPQSGQPVVDPKTKKPVEGPPLYHPPVDAYGAPHPQAGQPVLGYKNLVAEMDVDIILDTKPDTADIQQEQYQDLVQLVGSNPLYAQSVPFEVMLELSSVPHKKQLIDKLQSLRDQAQQAQQSQQQNPQAMLALEAAKAEVEKTHSETQLNLAKAGAEAAKPTLDIAKAEHQTALAGAKHGVDLISQAAAQHHDASQQQDAQRHEENLVWMQAAHNMAAQRQAQDAAQQQGSSE